MKNEKLLLYRLYLSHLKEKNRISEIDKIAPHFEELKALWKRHTTQKDPFLDVTLITILNCVNYSIISEQGTYVRNMLVNLLFSHRGELDNVSILRALQYQSNESISEFLDALLKKNSRNMENWSDQRAQCCLLAFNYLVCQSKEELILDLLHNSSIPLYKKAQQVIKGLITYSISGRFGMDTQIEAIKLLGSMSMKSSTLASQCLALFKKMIFLESITVQIALIGVLWDISFVYSTSLAANTSSGLSRCDQDIQVAQELLHLLPLFIHGEVPEIVFATLYGMGRSLLHDACNPPQHPEDLILVMLESLHLSQEKTTTKSSQKSPEEAAYTTFQKMIDNFFTQYSKTNKNYQTVLANSIVKLLVENCVECRSFKQEQFFQLLDKKVKWKLSFLLNKGLERRIFPVIEDHVISNLRSLLGIDVNAHAIRHALEFLIRENK